MKEFCFGLALGTMMGVLIVTSSEKISRLAKETTKAAEKKVNEVKEEVEKKINNSKNDVKKSAKETEE